MGQLYLCVCLSLIRIRMDQKYLQDMQKEFNLEIKAEKNSRIMMLFCVWLLVAL